MLRKLVIWFVVVPLAVIILMFALANRELVTVSFDPLSATNPAASVTLPLFVVIFILLILGVVIGGVAAWLRQGRYRRSTRLLEGDIAALRREVDVLNERLAAAAHSAPENAARIGYHPPANQV
jgi:uncharacterized integral membrane protein